MGKSTKKNSQKKTSPQYGFIYPALDWFLNLLRYFTLVEGFKFIGRVLAQKSNSQQTKNYERFSVDIFIVLKWLFVGILIGLKISKPIAIISVWYLLIANLYTYFYYHIWSSEFLSNSYFDTNRVKRRFTTLSLAISYTIFGFSYLYYIPYVHHFIWSDETPTYIKSFWFSISNSLTASYDQVKPITSFSNSVSMIQLLMMFVFLTIIIGGTIPQPNQSNKEG